MISHMISLHQERLYRTVSVLKSLGATRILALGCGCCEAPMRYAMTL